MTIHAAQLHLTKELGTLYDSREASNIAGWVLEHLTGFSKIDRLMHRDRELTATQAELLQRYTADLLKHRPVQYVLGEAWFAGMRFYVDENVLIPRPETDELVEWIVEEVTETGGAPGPPDTSNSDTGRQKGRAAAISNKLTILDVGTGSGCIPIALKSKLREATVYACDVS